MNPRVLGFLILTILHCFTEKRAVASSQQAPERQELATAVQVTVDLGPQVALMVPIAPTPVPIGDHVDLVYELHVSSYDNRKLTLQRAEVLADTQPQPLATFENDSLTRILGPGEPDSELTAHSLTPRQHFVLYLWIELDPKIIPYHVSHRLTFETESKREQVEGAEVQIVRRSPIVIGPPLRAGYWVATNSGNDTVHRRLIIAPEKKPVIGTRFATDWCKKGDNGLINRLHTPLRNEDFYCYGEQVIAVADATIASLLDGIPENQPNNLPPKSDLRTIAGNRVILDLGQSTFAIYAHLQPGSIKVKQGQRVHRGELLALVGNSGFSDGPHLHFQIADADGMAGDGLPYVLDTYESSGLNVEGKPVDASQHRRLIRGRFPAADEVITFVNK